MPKLRLSLQGQLEFDSVPSRSTLLRWITAAIERESELTVRFVGAREGRRLNRDYRGKDVATDVLTFSYATAPIVRADIVLCMPVIEREAAGRGKPLHDHLAHLAVHATLHAHGYHHDDEAGARAVEARERKILARLKKRPPY